MPSKFGGIAIDPEERAPIPVTLPSPENPDVSGLAARYPFAAGAAQGISEMASNVGNVLGFDSDPTVDPDYAKASYAAFAKENPSAEWGRETARITPALASAALPGGLAAQMGYSLPLATLEDDFEKAAITGVASTGLFGTIGKVFSGLRGNIASRGNLEGKAAEFAERGGYVPTGSSVEQIASKHPWTAEPFRKAAERNTEILTQDAIAALGNVTDNLTDEGLEQAGRVLGNQFDQLGNVIPDVKIPRSVKDFLGVLDKRAKVLAEIGPDLTQDVLSGRNVMMLRKRLTTLGQSADELVAGAAHRVRRALDDAISDAAPEGTSEIWAKLREQWRNYEYGIKKIKSATGRDPLTGQLKAPVTTNRMRNVYSSGPPTQAETRQLMDTAAVMSSDLFKEFSPNPSGTAAAANLLDVPAQITTGVFGALPALAVKSSGGATSGAVGRAGALQLLPPEEEEKSIPALLRKAP